MARRDTVGVGLVGSQFITTIHAEALRSGAAGRGAGRDVADDRARARFRVEESASRTTSEDLDAMLAMDEIDLVVVGAPNDLTARSRSRPRRPASTSSSRSRCA